MNLPIYIRKFWIQKHNRQAEEDKIEVENNSASKKIGGVALNAYAMVEQGKEGTKLGETERIIRNSGG